MGLGPNLGLALWDVSQTGACVVTKPGIAVKDDVELVITTTGLPKPMKVIGSVVWVEQLDTDRQSVGVRFQKQIPFAELSKLT
jgi:Tfp pilus assembly protein PilZ